MRIDGYARLSQYKLIRSIRFIFILNYNKKLLTFDTHKVKETSVHYCWMDGIVAVIVRISDYCSNYVYKLFHANIHHIVLLYRGWLNQL